MTRKRDLRIAIIGAGASGIMALIRLRESGYNNVTIFEKAGDLGGTWRDNRYPGLTCDVPSLAYRYSFAPNAEWSQTCAPGTEILAYLKGVAREYDVERFIRFDEEVLQAHYDDGVWHLSSAKEANMPFDAVVTATGVLHHPVYPDIDGLDTFRDLPPSEWPNFYFRNGHEGGMEWQGSTSRKTLSGSCVRRRSC